MIPALAPLFVGDLAPYRDALVLADDPRPSRPVRDWLAPDAFDQVLQAYGAVHDRRIDGLGDSHAGHGAQAPRPASNTMGARRGMASEWSKAYLLRLLPPVLAATLVLGHRLPLDLDAMALVLDDAGRPLAFKLPDAGDAWPVADDDDPFRRFAPLLDEHLHPLVALLAAHSRLSPRVFWSNAANYVEWMVGAIAAKVPAAQVADARALLERRHRDDGRDNPFHRPVRYRMEGEGAAAHLHRRRRVCCVRYLVPDTPLCTNCPLTAVPAAKDGGSAPDGV